MNSKLFSLVPILLATMIPAASADDRLNVAECFTRMPLPVFHEWYGACEDSTRRWQFAKELVAKAAGGKNEGWITVDIPNGYIVFTGDDGGQYGTLTLVLFRQPDGTALIAVEVRETYELYEIDLLERRPELKDADGDLSATELLRFYQVSGDGWKDVTGKTCPEAEAKEVRYELPRKGTTIQLFRRGAERPFRAWLRDGKGFKAKALK